MNAQAPWIFTGMLCLVLAGCSPNGTSEQEGSRSAGTADLPQDLPGTEVYRFECTELGALEFRFLGPDTIDVRFDGESYVMQQQRVASGARYAGDGAEFWNKGDQAMVIVGGHHVECSRIGNNEKGTER